VNSIILRSLCACARHARKRNKYTFLSWVLGLVTALLLTTPLFAANSLTGYAFYQSNGISWGVAGASIQLLDASNGPLRTTKTDATGLYTFNELEPGTYSVRNTTPNANWTPVVVNGAEASVTATEAEIDNITLDSDDENALYSFSADRYPLQLVSKRMLLASGGSKITPVPEPSTAVTLILGAIALGAWAVGRCYFKK